MANVSRWLAEVKQRSARRLYTKMPDPRGGRWIDFHFVREVNCKPSIGYLLQHCTGGSYTPSERLSIFPLYSKGRLRWKRIKAKQVIANPGSIKLGDLPAYGVTLIVQRVDKDDLDRSMQMYFQAIMNEVDILEFEKIVRRDPAFAFTFFRSEFPEWDEKYVSELSGKIFLCKAHSKKPEGIRCIYNSQARHTQNLLSYKIKK